MLGFDCHQFGDLAGDGGVRGLRVGEEKIGILIRLVCFWWRRVCERTAAEHDARLVASLLLGGGYEPRSQGPC